MATVKHRNALPEGYEFEGYRIAGVLGAGGFGVTYLAIETTTGRKVAIKEYMPGGMATRGENRISVHPTSTMDEADYEFGLSRFADEAKTLIQFNHPNVVPVLRFFEANGTAYLVMAYQEGNSLHEILAGGVVLSESEVREILYPVLDALRHVHDAGFLHRDIKPGNLFIRTDGTPILLDFGAARHALGEQSKSLTSIVTAGYAPFEQYTSRSKQGPWTDIYALGATIYRAVTGQLPPIASDRIDDDPYVPAAQAAKGRFDPKLLAAIDAALARRPEDRPQNIAELRALIDGPPLDVTGPVPPGPPPPPAERTDQPVQPVSPPPLPPRKTPVGLLVGLFAGLLVLGAAIGGGYYYWSEYQAAQRHKAEILEAKRRAEAERRAQAERATEEARRRAEEAARRAADSEARRKAEAQRKIEAQRKAEASRKAEAKKRALARKRAEEARRRAMKLRLTGSRWSYIDSDGDRRSFVFYSGGRMSCTNNGKAGYCDSDDNWRQAGRRVTLCYSNCYSVYRGTMNAAGNRITGRARNKRGRTWTFTMRRR